MVDLSDDSVNDQSVSTFYCSEIAPQPHASILAHSKIGQYLEKYAPLRGIEQILVQATIYNF
jgi:hypothetical protein